LKTIFQGRPDRTTPPGKAGHLQKDIITMTNDQLLGFQFDEEDAAALQGWRERLASRDRSSPILAIQGIGAQRLARLLVNPAEEEEFLADDASFDESVTLPDGAVLTILSGDWPIADAAAREEWPGYFSQAVSAVKHWLIVTSSGMCIDLPAGIEEHAVAVRIAADEEDE
jgi:hypothetical protein